MRRRSPKRPPTITHQGTAPFTGADGTAMTGSYSVSNGWLTVRTAYGTKGAAHHRIDDDPSGLASILMMELVNDDAARKAGRVVF